MVKVTKKTRPSKPAKPYPDFPLFAHATGRWAKKIRGRLHYFGPWADSQGALDKFLNERDDLYAGRRPYSVPDAITIRDLANRFLTAKQQLVDSGELSKRTFHDYFKTCERVINAFGLTRPVVGLSALDFEELRASIARTRRAVALGNEVQRVRSLFKYAFDAGLIPQPVRFGPIFRRPAKKELRRARQARGVRMFEAEQLRTILSRAKGQLRAMILLGINCGFGNADCAALPLSAVDLNRGWVEFPRPKTAITRRCPLWPESIEALRAAIETRYTTQDATLAELVFLTKQRQAWSRDKPNSPISREFAKLLVELELWRPGLNFYALRHSFETIGGEARDQVAVDHIMGHAVETMASIYRERISDERLKAVTDHVRTWLLGELGELR